MNHVYFFLPSIAVFIILSSDLLPASLNSGWWTGYKISVSHSSLSKTKNQMFTASPDTGFEKITKYLLQHRLNLCRNEPQFCFEL